MKYKWKDKVRIKSKKELECISEVTDDMLKNGGAIMTIACLVEDADGYIMKEDGDFHFLWTDEMIEGLVEDIITTNEQLFEPSNISLEKEMEWNLPEGYQFVDENGNIINATKIVLEKKKKEYPKTYKECCKVLGIEGNSLLINTKYTTDYERGLWNLMGHLHGLIICRDAYWKIAGEEMGLEKPWEPGWANLEYNKFCIWGYAGDITLRDVLRCQHILAFPTEEMRDAFYENFKSEIEICKELL